MFSKKPFFTQLVSLLLSIGFIAGCVSVDAYVTPAPSLEAPLSPTPDIDVPISPSPTPPLLYSTPVSPTLQPKSESVTMIHRYSELPRGVFDLSHDEIMIAITVDGLNVGLYDFRTGATIWEWSLPEADILYGPSWLHSVKFSPDDNYLVVGGLTKMLYILNPKTGELIARSEPGDIILNLAFLDDQRVLASTEDPNGVPSINFWDLPFVETHKLPYLGCTFSPIKDSTHLLAYILDPEPSIVLVDLKDSSSTTLIANSGTGCSLAVSPNGHFIAAEVRGGLRLWDLLSQPPQPIELDWQKDLSQDVYVVEVLFSPKNQLVIIDSDYTVSLWDLEAKKMLAILPEKTTFLRFTQDGQSILTLGETITSWTSP